MALHDFWANVRRAAKTRSPARIVDAPKLDVETLERVLRENPGWLTRKIVVGYSEADFEFLPEETRQRLTQLVKEVETITRQVPLTRPATDEQVESALPAVRDIMEILEFDRYGDPEALRIGMQVKRLIQSDGPGDLADLRFQTGPDWIGDPAIWIWAILRNESGKDDDFLKATTALHDPLWEASREIDPERIPYIRFRSVAGQAQLEEMRR